MIVDLVVGSRAMLRVPRGRRRSEQGGVKFRSPAGRRDLPSARSFWPSWACCRGGRERTAVSCRRARLRRPIARGAGAGVGCLDPYYCSRTAESPPSWRGIVKRTRATPRPRAMAMRDRLRLSGELWVLVVEPRRSFLAVPDAARPPPAEAARAAAGREPPPCRRSARPSRRRRSPSSGAPPSPRALAAPPWCRLDVLMAGPAPPSRRLVFSMRSSAR